MDETGSMNVLGFRIPVLETITILVGALALLVIYAAGLFSGRNNASANKDVTGRKGDRKIDDPRKSMNGDSSTISQNSGTATSNSVNSNGHTSGKRAKNKKRREAQQEFAHPWMVGALKGHTGPVLDMNFSSNGKFLASCAEDCDLVPEEEPELGDANSSSGEGDYVIESKSRCQGISMGSGSPPTATVVVMANNSGNKDAFVSSASSSVSELKKVQSSTSSLSKTSNEDVVVVAVDRATSLSRRQRKNRTRVPREQQPAHDRDEDNDDLIATKPRPRHHRMHHKPDGKLRHSRNESLTAITSDCNMIKTRNSSSAWINKKSSDNSKVSTINRNFAKSSLSTGINKINGINCGKSGLSTIAGEIDKNSFVYHENGSHQTMRHSYDRLNQFDDSVLCNLLRRYVLSQSQCVTHGYPVEFDRFVDCVYIKHFQRSSMLHQANVRLYHNLDANAREFVPRGNNVKCNVDKSVGRSLKTTLDSEIDSGTGSGSSVECSDQEPECSSDSDKSSDVGESYSSSSSSSSLSSSSSGYSEKLCDSVGNLNSSDSIESQSNVTIVERECIRCMTNFNVNRHTGEYIKEERCVYHWGKLLKSWIPGVQPRLWECCQSTENTVGCSTALMHVWSGLSPGYNGPYYDYVRTQPSAVFSSNGNYGVYALDCEMCFTRWGLELTRVTVVGITGNIVYDHLVKPKDEIIDYNTRFSGLTAEILSRATKTLDDVQKDILTFVHAETILIGHGLGNDLRVLKLLHRNVIDTTVTYPHVWGFPVRRSLKTLARSVLGREIQVATHDSAEDARAAAAIMLAKLWSDIY